MSDGGLCVLLDDDCGLTRGIEVGVAVGDTPSVRAWVCHNTRSGDTLWHLGMSFVPVEEDAQEQAIDPSTNEPGTPHLRDSNSHLHRLLVGDDLSLQIWQEADAEHAFDIVRDSRSDLEQWVEWVPQVHSADDLRGFIRYSVQQYGRGKTWQFAIRQKSQIIGGVGLVGRADNVGEIGYWLGAAYQGQGIATRCARRVVRFGFETLGLSSIELRCAVTNQRSRAVAQRLGFLHEGLVPLGQWTFRGMDDLMVFRSTQSSGGACG